MKLMSWVQVELISLVLLKGGRKGKMVLMILGEFCTP